MPEGTILPEPGTTESETFLWNMDGVCLEFTHNYGSENDDSFRVNNGNVEPHRSGYSSLSFISLPSPLSPSLIIVDLVTLL
jgi:hypothetical protein